jgi:hypothetical protein
MVDPLGDVPRSVLLTGGMFLDSELTAPWCVCTRRSAARIASPTQIIAYHFVVDGALWVSVDDDAVEAQGYEIVRAVTVALRHQCRKCRTPVSTMASPASSAAAITSLSLTEPPG